MSDLNTMILIEHPLNEKMRTWLRIEFLLDSVLIRYEAKKPYNGFVRQREKKKDFLHSE